MEIAAAIGREIRQRNYGMVIGFGAASSGNQVVVSGGGSLQDAGPTTVIGQAGSGTFTIAQDGSVEANSLVLAALAGSSGTLNLGSSGATEGNVALNVGSGTISFCAGSGTINFNQGDTFTLTAGISSGSTGINGFNHLGSGTTMLTGINSYT